MRRVQSYGPGAISTRSSLLGRLQNLEDQVSWQDFFETYWKLIYSAATKAGLSDQAAQEVVQETILTVSRRIQDFKYDPAIGSFKGWLLHTTRWRILDELKKQARAEREAEELADLQGAWEPQSAQIEAVWEAEWQQNLVDAAIHKIKQRVEPKHYQAFELYTLKEWPARRVATTLGLNLAQVHLIKHRLVKEIRKEVKRLERERV